MLLTKQNCLYSSSTLGHFYFWYFPLEIYVLFSLTNWQIDPLVKFLQALKGKYEDLYMGVKAETSRLSPLMSYIFISSVDPILRNCYNNPGQVPYFSYVYPCGESTFKTTIKTMFYQYKTVFK